MIYSPKPSWLPKMSTDSIWASLNEWIKEGQRRYHQSSPGRHLSELRQRTPLLDAVLLSGALLTSGWILRMGLRRFRTANDIPASFFSRHATLRGIVCCVNDSDNLRVLHLSPFQRFFPAPLPKQGIPRVRCCLSTYANCDDCVIEL